MSATLRNRLLTVWRRAIRCAAGAAYQSDIDPILKENKITDLTNRWIVQYAVFVRRCYRMEAPPAACKKLQVTSHVYQTRGNSSTFRPHRPVCNAGVRSFSNRAPLLWNALRLMSEMPHLQQNSKKICCYSYKMKTIVQHSTDSVSRTLASINHISS